MPADALQSEETGVTFVGVEHIGVDAECLERADATDPEEQLLLQAVLDIASVESIGDRPQLRRVLVDVCVEQIERHAADIGPPHLRNERMAGKIDRHAHAIASGQCHAERIQVGIPLLLPALRVERLAEVAVPVQESDTDERHTEIAGRLQMISGQHAESAGVLRKGFGDAELGREVRNLAERRSGAGLEPTRGIEVVLQLVVDLGEEAHERRVADQCFEAIRRDEPEQPDRVVHGRVPSVGIDPAEQVASSRVPRPPKVHRQALQGGQLVGAGGVAR